MNWVLDALMLLIMTLSIVIYMKKGFVSSLMGLVSFLLSLFGAIWISGLLAPTLYDWFVRDGLYRELDAGTGGFFTGVVNLFSDGGAAAGSVAAIDNAAISAVRIIAFILLFIILYLVLRLLERLFRNINRAPLVGLVNRVLGGVAGAGIGFIVSILVVAILSLLVAVSGDSFSWLNTSIIEDTLIFKLYYKIGFLNMLFG